MKENSRYALAVLALFAAFALVCGTWYLARASAPEPYLVTAARRPDPEESASAAEEPEEQYPDSLLPGERINVNTADVYDLQRLPGIGEKRAGDIVACRDEHGPFQTLEGLMEVSGIGPAILEGLRDYAVTGNE